MLETVNQLMKKMAEAGASDMYITIGRPIAIRVEDVFHDLPDIPKVTPDFVNGMIDALLNERQKRDFQNYHEMNLSFGVPGVGRFRINVMQQRQSPSMVIRAIKSEVPRFETLGLPESLRKVVLHKRGIVLLCGMTGSGKSTTLAALIDHRNETMQGHILTIEDPIEYLYEHKKSLVTQREVGTDTDNYHVALKNAFRQKPDVILLGEIRDRFVMEQALTAAETGHLCLSTIHANNAYQAIERILNFFEDDQMNQARTNLAMNLRAIVSQRLIPGVDGKMVLSYEILVNEGYVRELITKGETAKIREVMAQNRAAGMNTFDQNLLELYKAGRISAETAVLESDLPVDMELAIKRDKAAQAFS